MSFGNISLHINNKKKHFSLPNEAIRCTISKIIEKEVCVVLDISKIKINNSIIKVKADPLIKNEIFMKKYIILESLKKKYKEKTPKDIR